MGLYRSDFNNNDRVWDLIFKSFPCIKNFNGTLASWGGKLEKTGPNNFILSVGDAFHDGINNDDITKKKDSSYGKIFSFDTNSNQYNIFTKGHRNPQGLHFDGTNIFETEHGPVGGDELNILRINENYGWPYETYGKEYSSNTWPPNPNKGFHSNFSKPLFAWIPSIGVSDLTKIPNEHLSPWKGDIIISSLSAQSIYRMRFIDDNKLQNIEKIKLNHRIRSIKLLKDNIFFSTDNEGLLGIISIK